MAPPGELTLALLTCGPQLEVALRRDGGVPSLVRLAGGSPRSTLVMAAVDLLVEDAGAAPASIGRVLVSRGPGSFTGIRAGLATASGLRAALGLAVRAFDSLTVQAARVAHEGTFWAAQPGRRGEVYAQPFRCTPSTLPQPLGDVQIIAVSGLRGLGPCIAADTLDLGDAERARAALSAAEALLRLDLLGQPPDPVEPLYVEGPPIQGAAG